MTYFGVGSHKIHLKLNGYTLKKKDYAIFIFASMGSSLKRKNSLL